MQRIDGRNLGAADERIDAIGQLMRDIENGLYINSILERLIIYTTHCGRISNNECNYVAETDQSQSNHVF